MVPSLFSKARKVSLELFVLWKDDELPSLAQARPAAKRPTHCLHSLSLDTRWSDPVDRFALMTRRSQCKFLAGAQTAPTARGHDYGGATRGHRNRERGPAPGTIGDEPRRPCPDRSPHA